MSPAPNRSCVGCRRVREKGDLLRLSFDGRTIRIDPKGRLPGRGLYLCRDEACLVLAETRRAFARWIDADGARRLAAEIREVLGAARPGREEPLLGLLGLARRGGGVEVGLRAAVEGLRAGEGRLLVTARDISERGAREAAEAARAAGVPHVVLGTRASLGGALGRDEVVAALVTSSDAARGLAAAVDKASGSPTGARER
jgi:predicted RNA-binding protein YlxR (DUF448 family)/ribosomal protein L7Ae-like RNA K-turn-binding protein